MILCRSYLLFSSSVALFRVSMYITNLELVTKVKISSKFWSDPAIQEVAYAYTRVIGYFMLFKGIIFGYCGYYLPNSSQYQEIIALTSFGFDVISLGTMIARLITRSRGGQAGKGGEGKVKNEENKEHALLPPTTAALTVQSLLTSSYLICHGLEYFRVV